MWNKSLFVLTAVFGCALASPIGLTHDKTRQQFIDEINSTPNITWFAAAHPRFEGYISIFLCTSVFYCTLRLNLRQYSATVWFLNVLDDFEYRLAALT